MSTARLGIWAHFGVKYLRTDVERGTGRSLKLCGGVFNIKSHSESYCTGPIAVLCVWLTNVDSFAEALHQQQHKHMQGNQVDNKYITSPRRHLEHRKHVNHPLRHCHYTLF